MAIGGGQLGAAWRMVHHDPAGVTAPHAPCILRQVGVVWGCGIVRGPPGEGGDV